MGIWFHFVIACDFLNWQGRGGRGGPRRCSFFPTYVLPNLFCPIFLPFFNTFWPNYFCLILFLPTFVCKCMFPPTFSFPKNLGQHFAFGISLPGRSRVFQLVLYKLSVHKSGSIYLSRGLFTFQPVLLRDVSVYKQSRPMLFQS